VTKHPTGAWANWQPFAFRLFGAATLVVVALWFAANRLGTPDPKMNKEAFASLGAFAAEETAQLLGQGGAVLLVSAVPDQNMADNDPLVHSLATLVPQISAFKARLQQQGKFTFLPDLKLPQPVGAQSTVWPAGKLAEVLAKTPPKAALVLFCSLPGAISDAERQQLRQRPGKTIVAGVLDMKVRPWLDEKLVHLAIAVRTPVPQRTADSETPTEWVRRVFVSIGPGQP